MGSSPTIAAKSLRARSASLCVAGTLGRGEAESQAVSQGSFHVIMVQEAETRHSVIAKEAEQQFGPACQRTTNKDCD